MKLKFKIEGGFLGRTQRYETEVSGLPPEQQNTVRAFLENDEHVELKSNPLARDIYNYTLEIGKENGETQSITFDDLSIPKELSTLVKYLKSKANE